MGQQQLLLVILVTIIVGIATVVAINTFGAAADSANVDAVRQDLLTIASAAQGFYMRPEMLGGGGRSFEDLTWTSLGSVPGNFSAADGDAPANLTNDNGVYTFEAPVANAQEFIVTAAPASGGAIAIRVCADNARMGTYAETGDAPVPPVCNPS